MIIEIEKLKKIDDIISCEGSILSVYKYNNKLYLASHLIDGSGVVFYSTNDESLLSYLHSKITLSDLYQLSNDIFVTRKFQKDSKLFLSDDFSLLDCFVSPLLWRLTQLGIELSDESKALDVYMKRVFKRDSFQSSLTDAEKQIREAA